MTIPNLTPRASQSLVLAQKTADEMGHSYIGIEHLFIGILRLGQGTVPHVLRDIGIDPGTLQDDFTKAFLASLRPSPAPSFDSAAIAQTLRSLADKLENPS